MMHKHSSREGGSQNIKIATLLNIGFTVLEFIGGVLTNSLTLISNALHDLGDSIVLLSSWKIERESQRRPDWKKSFGYYRLSLLAAFLNAIILLGGSIVIIFQVIGRLIEPEPVKAIGVIWLAVVGIIANLLGTWQLRKGHTLNEKILSWHLLEDVLGWLAVLLSGIIMYLYQIYIIDPLITIGFSLFILWGVWRNSKELINVFLEGVPSPQSLTAIFNEIENVPGILKIYDIHLWSLDGKHNIFSMKATVTEGIKNDDPVRKKVEEALLKHKISHSTIELSDSKYPSARQEQKFLEEDN
jgi:cobalt-zinc-cadmium efflux system protein